MLHSNLSMQSRSELKWMNGKNLRTYRTQVLFLSNQIVEKFSNTQALCLLVDLYSVDGLA